MVGVVFIYNNNNNNNNNNLFIKVTPRNVYKHN